MTPTKYFFARVALAFGIQRRNIRMADAATESHLLRDAELLLGHELWEKCEHLEEVSVEYWNVRKLTKEIALKTEHLTEFQAKLDAAHEERAQILLAATGVDPEVTEQRSRLIHELDHLAVRRDEIIVKARQVRRTFEGLKAKLEVLIESGPEQNEKTIENCKLRMREIKQDFEALKLQRAAIATELDAKDAELRQLEDGINSLSRTRKFDFSKTFATISQYNQEVSNLNAEIGLLQKRKSELCMEIGRYLSRNSSHPECLAIYKKHRGLVDVMAALRRSISYNHRIAGV